MGAPDRIRPLLAADVALRLGLVKPWDVMAALQARGSKGHESLQEFLADLSRVAQLGPDALAQIQAETQRRVGEEAGDAMRALSRLGGPAASLVPRPEMAASPAEPASSTASPAACQDILLILDEYSSLRAGAGRGEDGGARIGVRSGWILDSWG